MLHIDQLTIAYGKTIAVDALSLRIPKGEIHGIAGLNGAGKTSTLNCIFGFVKQQSGTITWKDAKDLRASTSYLESVNYFYPGITGEEYLSLFSDNNDRIAQWNALLKLPLKQVVDGYSSGMKKRLALAGTLLLSKELVLMDEPFNALDMEGVELLKVVLQQLKLQGTTILITSHILETLTQSCDAIHLVEQGQLKASYMRGDFEKLEALIRTQAGKQWEDQIRDLIQKA